MNTIAVLMWKHMVVRKRRFIITIIDLLCPLAFFVLLYMFKGFINPVPKSALSEQFTIQNTEPVDITDLPRPTAVFYNPDTDLTSLLMDKVGEALLLRRNKYTPGYLERNGYMPFTNLFDILKSNRELSHLDAIVFFGNMSGTWPDRLNYTIRMKGDFQTDRVATDDGMLGPHESFGTIYEPFMRLQWAIDSSYLKLLSGNNIEQRVMIQEFPYVREKEAPVIKTICYLLTYTSWMSLLLTFVFVMSKLLEERISGIQELIKMVGVSNAQLSLSHFLNMMPVGLVYCIGGTMLLKMSSNPIIPMTSSLLIAIFLALLFIYVWCLAYCCSYFVKSMQYSVSIATLMCVVLITPMRYIDGKAPSWSMPLVSLVPYAPMFWFWSEVGEMEAYGKGADFGSISKAHSESSGSILAALIALMVQSLMYLMLAWYLSLVNPGPYGQPLPWNFLCSSSFWSKKQVVPEDETEELTNVHDPQYFEAPPKDMHPGIRITNVSKVFPKHRALSNVSLDVYRGEITVLLGHNGAGKTTLMSIITGMLNASEGKVYVEGLDTVSQKAEMRKLLGLCPQHNLFFPDLTILEHVIFFSMLKGNTYKEANESSMELLGKLGLGDKGSARSEDLSGGMKRRLQLACSLAGDATVLVLDEPTSGLDVETRRELWDLLLSLRGSRTVLLSTHFMEEADALGDRVAALHAGRLVCHATTMHLKRAIGTGYRLSFITMGPPKEAAITSVITSQVHDATLKEQSLNGLSYNLPATSTPKFPKLFNLLESKRSELGITSIGVGISTLEEVFLKLCSDTTTFSSDEVDGAPSEPTYKHISGAKLYLRQFMILVYRQLQYLYHRKFIFLAVSVVAPLLMFFSVSYMTNETLRTRDADKNIALDLELYQQPHRRVMIDVAPGTNVRALGDSYPKVDFEVTRDVAGAILRTGKKDVFEYNKYLVGIELNETHANALYTTLFRHAAPVSLSVLSNALATRLIPAADGRVLTTHIQPFQTAPTLRLISPKQSSSCMLWGVLVCMVILTSVLNYMSLTCIERESGTRHQHILAGCPPALHWAATLATHATLCVITLVLPATLMALLDSQDTINKPEFMAATFVILVCLVLSFLAFSYFVSLHVGETATSIILFVCVILFGFITPTVVSATEAFQQSFNSFWDYLLVIASYTMPPHRAARAMTKATNCAYINAMCTLNRENGCKVPGDMDGMDVEKCCVKKVNPRCYFCFDNYSPMREILFMIFQFLFYMAVVDLCERGMLSQLLKRTFNSRYQPTTTTSTDMVAAEKQYVDKAIALPKREISDAVLVNDVYKRYFSLLSKPFEAVKGISFSVKRGECFGLLGVNGAGKTSTFKMLVGLEYPSKGSIFVNGHFMSRASSEYMQSLGYCPQFFGLDPFLSGHDNLALMLTLRGLDKGDMEKEVDTWIKIVGLERYASLPVSGYSGGCARRLSAAASLCGGAPVALLDEPTAGVDVAARRRVWAALRRAAPNRAIVITSHSMDEMEALCNRIGIMVAGKLRALGSPAELRATHAAGHTLRLKLTPASVAAHADETDSGRSDVVRLKVKLHETFDCVLKDEHKTMLHYHINDTLRYSELFRQLEHLKKDFPALLEDYDITETTLEEVFLALAREQFADPAGSV